MGCHFFTWLITRLFNIVMTSKEDSIVWDVLGDRLVVKYYATSLWWGLKCDYYSNLKAVVRKGLGLFHGSVTCFVFAIWCLSVAFVRSLACRSEWGVRIAAGWTIEELWFEYRKGKETFLFSKRFRPVRGSTLSLLNAYWGVVPVAKAAMAWSWSPTSIYCWD